MSEISDVILELTGERPYQTLGKELRYRCFFCNNPKNKFYISAKTGEWVCFNEGVHGTLYTLIGKLTGKNYGQSKHWLKVHQFDNPQIVEVERKAPDDLFTQILDLQAENDESIMNINKLSMPTPPTNCKYLLDNFYNQEAYPYFNYCHMRGLSIDDIKKAHISYVTYGMFKERDGLMGHISNSILFFTYDRTGRPIYWNTRNIYNGFPKSLNASAQTGQISRREAVFNLNNYLSTQDIAIAEGVFNALTINCPRLLGVATFGKNISSYQLSEIAHTLNSNQCVYICLDSDAFSLTNDVYSRLMKYGLTPRQIKIVDDRCLGSSDWNDIGHVQSIKLINERAFQPSLLSKIKKLI